MKFYGYPLHDELPDPLELSEISFLGSEASLREVAKFLIRCADEIASIEQIEGANLHFHLREDVAHNEIEGDIVVVPLPK